jgi:hypothetical protein
MVLFFCETKNAFITLRRPDPNTGTGVIHKFLNTWWYKRKRRFRSMSFQRQLSKVMGYLIAISTNLLD